MTEADVLGFLSILWSNQNKIEQDNRWHTMLTSADVAVIQKVLIAKIASAERVLRTKRFGNSTETDDFLSKSPDWLILLKTALNKLAPNTTLIHSFKALSENAKDKSITERLQAYQDEHARLATEASIAREKNAISDAFKAAENKIKGFRIGRETATIASRFFLLIETDIVMLLAWIDFFLKNGITFEQFNSLNMVPGSDLVTELNILIAKSPNPTFMAQEVSSRYPFIDAWLQGSITDRANFDNATHYTSLWDKKAWVKKLYEVFGEAFLWVVFNQFDEDAVTYVQHGDAIVEFLDPELTTFLSHFNRILPGNKTYCQTMLDLFIAQFDRQSDEYKTFYQPRFRVLFLIEGNISLIRAKLKTKYAALLDVNLIRDENYQIIFDNRDNFSRLIDYFEVSSTSVNLKDLKLDIYQFTVQLVKAILVEHGTFNLNDLIDNPYYAAYYSDESVKTLAKQAVYEQCTPSERLRLTEGKERPKHYVLSSKYNALLDKKLGELQGHDDLKKLIASWRAKPLDDALQARVIKDLTTAYNKAENSIIRRVVYEIFGILFSLGIAIPFIFRHRYQTGRWGLWYDTPTSKLLKSVTKDIEAVYEPGNLEEQDKNQSISLV